MTLWLRDNDWEFHTHPIDTPSAELPWFQGFIDLWRTKITDRFPAWRDFDFLDFEEWWGWISVYDAVPGDPESFDIRLWGTKIADFTGYDLTGRRLHTANPQVPEERHTSTGDDLRFIRHLLDEKLIGTTNGHFSAEGSRMGHYQEIHLPLASNGCDPDSMLFLGRCEY